MRAQREPARTLSGMNLDEIESVLSADDLVSPEPHWREELTLVVGLGTLALLALYVLCMIMSQGVSEILEVVSLLLGDVPPAQGSMDPLTLP